MFHPAGTITVHQMASILVCFLITMTTTVAIFIYRSEVTFIDQDQNQNRNRIVSSFKTSSA